MNTICKLYNHYGYYGSAQPIRKQSKCFSTLLTENRNNNASILIRNQMARKYLVLQYLQNSMQLTKQQRYSLIAQGKWTNRTTTWASQSSNGTSNPNTQRLKRVNGNNVVIICGIIEDMNLPVTVPNTIIINNSVLPLPINSTNNNNTNASDFVPPFPAPPPPPTPYPSPPSPSNATNATTIPNNTNPETSTITHTTPNVAPNYDIP